MLADDKAAAGKIGNIFYGWWIVAAGIVLCLFGYGGWYYSFGALFNPISTEFGWSRATTSIVFSLSRLEGGLEGLITGPIADKLGPRFLVRVGWTMAALGFLLMFYIQSFWMFVVSYSLLLSLGMNAGLYMPLQTSVAKWFNEKRGRALGFLTAGGALGGSIIVPVVAWLITTYDWRTTMLVLAATAFALGWGMSFVLKPHGPEHYGLQMDGKTQKPVTDTPATAKGEHTKAKDNKDFEGLTLKESMRTQAFWLLIVAFIFGQTTLSAIVVHQIPLIEDMGISKVIAASALGTMTLMSVPGRLAGGWLADRWEVKYLYFIACIVQAIGLFILARATSMPWVWVFVVVYGLSYGMRITIVPAMRAKLFGWKAFGAIMGYTNAFAILGAFAGPFFAGWIYDTTNSYSFAFFTFAAAITLGGILVLFIKYPMQQPQS
ncbi:MAG: MFS transporter [Chloroflexota bacterium]|nr:MAG: MFS transporter [Chloroflexota bacterium]